MLKFQKNVTGATIIPNNNLKIVYISVSNSGATVTFREVSGITNTGRTNVRSEEFMAGSLPSQLTQGRVEGVLGELNDWANNKAEYEAGVYGWFIAIPTYTRVEGVLGELNDWAINKAGYEAGVNGTEIELNDNHLGLRYKEASRSGIKFLLVCPSHRADIDRSVSLKRYAFL